MSKSLREKLFEAVRAEALDEAISAARDVDLDGFVEVKIEINFPNEVFMLEKVFEGDGCGCCDTHSLHRSLVDAEIELQKSLRSSNSWLVRAFVLCDDIYWCCGIGGYKNYNSDGEFTYGEIDTQRMKSMLQSNLCKRFPQNSQSGYYYEPLN